MIEYIVIIIIISIIVSIITEQLLIRRLRLEEGVIISKGKCILKTGYGQLNQQTPNPTSPTSPTSPPELDIRNNFNSELLGFYNR
jgi:hypothetical protein